jgi:hypothetical protein
MLRCNIHLKLGVIGTRYPSCSAAFRTANQGPAEANAKAKKVEIAMWPYTSEEQVWLVPAKDWVADRLAAEAKKRKAGEKPSAMPAPHPMPAPYDDGISDPQLAAARP